MTHEEVRHELDRWLRYLQDENFQGTDYCYAAAFGAVEMAATIAWKLGQTDLEIIIQDMWDNEYRGKFLDELAKQKAK